MVQRITDKDDDPHSPFSSRASDAVVGTNRSSYQKQESIENDEEGLAVETDECTSSASTSSSVSTSSSCYDENEQNMWNPLLELFCHVQVGLRMATLVDVVATARVALSCHFALDLLVDKSAVVDFLRSGCWGSSPFLTHLCLHKPFRLTNSLAHSLHCTGGKKVTLRPSVYVVKPCRKAVSTEDMQTSTASILASLKHHSLRVLREYHFISRLTMPIMGNSESCSKPCWRLAATSCKRLPHMKRR